MRLNKTRQSARACTVGFFHAARFEHYLRIGEAARAPRPRIRPRIDFKIHPRPTFPGSARLRTERPSIYLDAGRAITVPYPKIARRDPITSHLCRSLA